MYTLDEINTIVTDLNACGQSNCSVCSRAVHGRPGSDACFALAVNAASVIRWLLSEFHRYSGEQMEVSDNA